MSTVFTPMTGRDYPLGVTGDGDGWNVACELHAMSKCGIRIREKGCTDVCEIVFSDLLRQGNLYCVHIPLEAGKEYEYSFFADDRMVADPYAKAFAESIAADLAWGTGREELWYRVSSETYDWEDDTFPGTAYEDSIFYGIHVRGFTRHPSSGCKHKGTFAGVAEKMEYLKELGITAIECMPLYEFDEVISPGLDQVYMLERYRYCERTEQKKINYWGYCDAQYCMPKYAYSSKGNPQRELKDLIRMLHRAGIEFIMQIYFRERTNYRFIEEVLRYWAREYHVDGFHLLGNDLPMREITTDPYLADRKLIYYGFDLDNADITYAGKRRLAVFDDHYMNLCRCFLKGDNDTIQEAFRLIRNNPDRCGCINYLTNHDTMTIADMVSYDRKHNEENGENNADGRDYNYSWNCGVEGPSRKKPVVELRKRMMRNAMTLLILSAGTPYITAGDELGRSTRGNNNPYCQDNELNWLNWNLTKTNRDYAAYVRQILTLRKQCALFRKRREYTMMDTTGCGYPDLSVHSDEAWKAKLNNYDHAMGLMYCGRNGAKEELYYIAYNMYWQDAGLAFPRPPKGKQWKVIADTAGAQEELIPTEQDLMTVTARSIRLMTAVSEAPKHSKGRGSV